MRGISFGGMLDGGALPLEDGYFDTVRTAGFDTVRLPVKWSAHETPDRVDRAVEGALRRDLGVVLDAHHFDGGDLASLWARVAPRYADAGARLRFELLNEPHEPRPRGRRRVGAHAWAPAVPGRVRQDDMAEMLDRAAWTALVRSEAERLGVAWAYWDFATDFGAYDRAAGTWREPLRRALLGG